MKEALINLADGCMDIYKKSGDPKEAIRGFRMMIQAAYDLGVRDTAGAKTNPVQREDPKPQAAKPQPAVPTPQAPAEAKPKDPKTAAKKAADEL